MENILVIAVGIITSATILILIWGTTDPKEKKQA